MCKPDSSLVPVTRLSLCSHTSFSQLFRQLFTTYCRKPRGKESHFFVERDESRDDAEMRGSWYTSVRKY